MKYRIQHFNDVWYKQWTLSYRWEDEGGGGWHNCGNAPFRWWLQWVTAPIHKRWHDREVKKIGGTIRFEL